MTPKASIFNQLFDLPPRWRATLRDYSVDSLHFIIEYSGSVMICPLCGIEAEVIRRRELSWKPRDFLGYQITMTARLPVIEAHNEECRVEKEQSVLGNTLFLDLILRQVKFTQLYNPFQYLLTAVEAPPKLSLPRLDDEAWRLSPHLTLTEVEENNDE